MKKTMTETGMKGRIKELEASNEKAHKIAGENYAAHENMKKRRDSLQERLDTTIAQLRIVQIENAELHGFINRVEIEDDRLWHRYHGAKTSTNVVGEKAREVILPTLRQRLRGARYSDDTKPDIFQSGFKGRTTRFAGEDR